MKSWTQLRQIEGDPSWGYGPLPDLYMTIEPVTEILANSIGGYNTHCYVSVMAVKRFDFLKKVRR